MSVQEHQKINSAVQPTTVKSEYASVGDLEMYYEIHSTGDRWFCFTVLSCRQPSIRHSPENCQVIAVDLQGHGQVSLNYIMLLCFAAATRVRFPYGTPKLSITYKQFPFHRTSNKRPSV